MTNDNTEAPLTKSSWDKFCQERDAALEALAIGAKPHMAERDRVVALAQAEYDRIETESGTKYRAAVAPLIAEYERIAAAAWQKHNPYPNP